MVTPETNPFRRAARAAPGAGLPRLQAWALRPVRFPAFCRQTSWDQALTLFAHEGAQVLAVAQALTSEALPTRALTRVRMGIKDSARDGSAAMVLEHLIGVGSRVATGVVERTHGPAVTAKADIVDLKPKGRQDAGILATDQPFLAGSSDTPRHRVGDRDAAGTAPLFRRPDRAAPGVSGCA